MRTLLIDTDILINFLRGSDERYSKGSYKIRTIS